MRRRKTLTIKLRPQAAFASGNPLTADDVIFSYSRAVKMNKSPAFILNVLGWQPDNIDAQLKKIDEHSLQLSWTADVSPAVALNILSTPIAWNRRQQGGTAERQRRRLRQCLAEDALRRQRAV